MTETAAIERIDAGEFRDLAWVPAAQARMRAATFQELTHWATPDRSRVGVVLYDLFDKDFGWVAFWAKREEAAYDAGVSYPSAEAATAALVVALQRGGPP